MKKFNRENVLKVLVVVMSLVCLFYGQYMVWNDTTTWLSDEFVKIIQEDNGLKA